MRKVLLAASLLIFTLSCNLVTPDYETGGSSARLLLPDNAEIVSAELFIYASPVTPAPTEVNMHRITADWEETTVTWSNFAGAYDPAILDSESVDPASWYSFNILPYIEGWQNGDYPNYGLLLDQVDLSGYISYGSKDRDTYRPYIKVSFMIEGQLLEEDPEIVTADSYIWEPYPDNSYGLSPILYTGFIGGGEKQTLIRFDLEEKPGEIVGTGTPGYWKNHPEAWPVDEITIGGRVYSKRKAICLMWMPVRSYKWFTMFRHLVAAKLNIANGTNPQPIADIILQADQWMADTSIRESRARFDAWKYEGKYLAEMLDKYNNGLLEGAPSRDSLE